MDCEYADSDNMLIDAIIAGVREKRVQERLLDKGEDLMLAKDIEIPQQFEMSQKQMIVREEDAQVPTMSKRPKRTVYNKKKYSQVQPTTYQQRQTAGKQTNNCFRCGKHPQHAWNQGKYPSIGSVCSHCHKPNHWVAACHSHGVSSVSVESAEEDPPDEEILDINLTQEEIPVAIVAGDKWLVNISVLAQEVQFRIDTGAKCNTLTLDSYQSLEHPGELMCSSRILRSYSNHKLKPVTAVDLSLKYKDCETQAELEIMDIAQENVLSGVTAER
ncbi:hypothetical protein ABVT39_000466 [Epinephelus coioides]